MKALTPTRRADLDHWQELYTAGMLTPAPARRLAEHFIREVPRDSSVLFAGAGVGQLVEMVGPKRPDLVWTLVDYSQVALDRARVRLGAANIAAMLLADLNGEWPWPKDAFDVVLLCDVLEYLTAPLDAIREARRVASKGLAVTMQTTADAFDPTASWLFEPVDPWRMIGGSLRVIHLTSSGRIASFVTL